MKFLVFNIVLTIFELVKGRTIEGNGDLYRYPLQKDRNLKEKKDFEFICNKKLL